MSDFNFGQWASRSEYWLRKISFTLGACFDWLLKQALGVGLPVDWSEFELAEVIRRRSTFYGGRRMAPHCFQLSVGWRTYRESNGRTLAEWEAWLTSAASAEISRQELFVFAPVEVKARVNLFADTVSIEASYGKFESLLAERQRQQAGAGTAERPYALQCHCRLTAQTSAGRREWRLLLKPGQERFYLGSSRDCDVILAGERVSPVHAVLFLNAQGQLLLADVGSQFGTWVAERKIEPGETIVLDDETALLIGNASVLLHKE
jgi:hypothetical protein